MKLKLLITLPVSLFVSNTLLAQGIKQTTKPNIIFILTDDQGYGDLACHGNKWIKTPELDKIHSEGVRFTNFHSGTTSAPTRASLMTGKHFDRVGVWHTVGGRSLLKPDEKTMANKLQAAGYKTAIFGKWHLGDNYPFRPNDRGFDESLIHKGGGVGQSPDYWGNDYFNDTYFRNGKPEPHNGYCTDIWFAEAIRFIKKNKEKPFFCYIATNAPHSPYYVDPKYAAPYANNPDIPSKEFYGMIANIDENIGKLRQSLQKLGIADNTILVFMTDNGATGGLKSDKNGFVEKGFNAGMRGYKGSPYEGGHRVPFFLYWKNGNIVGGKDIDYLTYAPDFMPTILDLCGIKPKANENFDGESLRPILEKSSTNLPERMLIVDTQRDEKMMKWKQSVVMYQQWRLVNKNELYKIGSDPEQRNNVSSQHPDIVSKMQTAYEDWWKGIEPLNNEVYRIIVGTSHENPVVLCSHDLHTYSDIPSWNQTLVREAKGASGKWLLTVAKSGNYEIRLMRWPTESSLKIGEAASDSKPLPGGEIPYKKGISLNIVNASICIGDQKYEKATSCFNQSKVTFIQNLNKGDIEISAAFTDIVGKNYPAFYVEIEKQ